MTWERDRATLTAAGLRVAPSREGPSFVQAQVGDGAETEVLQWVQDSAFRFFPLVEDETFGLTLHPLRSRHEQGPRPRRPPQGA